MVKRNKGDLHAEYVPRLYNSPLSSHVSFILCVSVQVSYIKFDYTVFFWYPIEYFGDKFQGIKNLF